jgi:predicted ester cyclase
MPDGTELAPTGKKVELHGMELVKLRDGKIVVDNLYYDNLSIAVQLGILPESVTTTV